MCADAVNFSCAYTVRCISGCGYITFFDSGYLDDIVQILGSLICAYRTMSITRKNLCSQEMLKAGSFIDRLSAPSMDTPLPVGVEELCSTLWYVCTPCRRLMLIYWQAVSLQ